MLTIYKPYILVCNTSHIVFDIIYNMFQLHAQWYFIFLLQAIVAEVSQVYTLNTFDTWNLGQILA